MARRQDRQYERDFGSRTERLRSRSREATSRGDFRPSAACDESRRRDNHSGSRNDMRHDDARSQYDQSPRSLPRRRDNRDDLHLPLWTRPVPREERGRFYRRDDDTSRNQYYHRRNRRSEERQQRSPREGNLDDERQAPLHQQISWGKHITRHGMTPEAILTLFEQSGHRFEARNLATAVHRIGKLGGRNIGKDPRLARLIAMCGRRIGEFEPQAIANSVWGCAKTGTCEPRFFEAVAAEVPRRIGEFNAQDMASMVWAFDCVGWEQHDLFR